MNLFECRYYWLNRRLLTTFGLWPYQRNSPNIYKHVLVFVSLLSLTAAQIAKLVTVGWTTDITAEILSDQVSTFTCMTKYMIYIINKNKVKDLLENIKTSWESATNDDLKILHDMTEKGRKYNLYFMCKH